MVLPACQERDWPDPVGMLGESAVDFYLRYRGPLHAQTQDSTRAKEKHEIRTYLSLQLGDLWKVEPRLSRIDTATLQQATLRGRFAEVPRPLQTDSAMFYVVPLSGFRFIPLINRPHELLCHLDIRFLRREAPGEIIYSGGGDLDNRLKTLLDALRIPHNEGELAGFKPKYEGETLFSLLEDDALISKITVETGRLLGPMGDGERQSDVDLSIHVTVKVGYPMVGNIGWEA